MLPKGKFGVVISVVVVFGVGGVCDAFIEMGLGGMPFGPHKLDSGTGAMFDAGAEVMPRVAVRPPVVPNRSVFMGGHEVIKLAGKELLCRAPNAKVVKHDGYSARKVECEEHCVQLKPGRVLQVSVCGIRNGSAFRIRLNFERRGVEVAKLQSSIVRLGDPHSSAASG